MNAPVKPQGRGPRVDALACAAYLAGLLILMFAFMRPMLFRAWFFSSDEYVVAAEVVRFSNLDFRQHFFDMPGTPFMLLNALLWFVAYAASWVIGAVPRETPMSSFTYQHMPLLMVALRAFTQACGLLSVVLLFRLCAKLTNKVAAAAAATLLAFSPTFAVFNGFVRTESLAMVLILGALLCLNRALADDAERAPGIRDYAIIAGILAGIAAGARLHSMTSVLPVVALTLWFNKPFRGAEYPRWVLRWSMVVLPILWLGAARALMMVQHKKPDYFPAAMHLVLMASWVVIGGSVAAVVLYAFGPTRALLVRVLTPDLVKVLLGFGVGCVLGNPTVFAQRRFFFQSVQMYSGYLDRDRMSWPLGKNLVWYVKYYFDVVAPDKLTLLLLAAGCIAIVATRNRKLLPYLIGAALFFVSKPLNLVAGKHHVILWMPYFFVVCGYPVGLAWRKISERLPERRVALAAALAGLALVAGLCLSWGPKTAAVSSTDIEVRLHNVESATAWIKSHAETKSTIAISYFCFNSDVFYEWLKFLEVPLPKEALDGRDYQIWWGNRSTLKGRTGYACATPLDVPFIKTRLDLSSPGEGTDPYTDAHFTPAATFGSGESRVNLFRFDYR
ncbi:MAG: glycosyltransferase family 39 protein [Candidatus Solibacter sp.]